MVLYFNRIFIFKTAIEILGASIHRTTSYIIKSRGNRNAD